MSPARRGAIAVFAKAPRPGAVKTRMTPPLTADEAAGLYANLLADVLEATAGAAVALELECVLAVHPPGACGDVAWAAPEGFRAIAQRGASLSYRMDRAVREIAAGGAAPILLRGSDSPVLGATHLGDALAALETCDLVLCPDRDGGYNLVGLRAPAPGLFDHRMSTDTVLRDTLANAAALGLDTRVLDPSFDLDTIEDLRWLAEARGSASAGLCVKTLDYLDKHGLWRHLDSGAGGG